MTTNNPYPQIPLSAGAVTAECQDPGTPAAFRYFEGSRWVIYGRDDIGVYISGAQHHDGSVTRDIVVHELHHDEPITVEQARQLTAAFTAADEASGRTGTTGS